MKINTPSVEPRPGKKKPLILTGIQARALKHLDELPLDDRSDEILCSLVALRDEIGRPIGKKKAVAYYVRLARDLRKQCLEQLAALHKPKQGELF